MEIFVFPSNCNTVVFRQNIRNKLNRLNELFRLTWENVGSYSRVCTVCHYDLQAIFLVLCFCKGTIEYTWENKIENRKQKCTFVFSLDKTV